MEPEGEEGRPSGRAERGPGEDHPGPSGGHARELRRDAPEGHVGPERGGRHPHDRHRDAPQQDQAGRRRRVPDRRLAGRGRQGPPGRPGHRGREAAPEHRVRHLHERPLSQDLPEDEAALSLPDARERRAVRVGGVADQRGPPQPPLERQADVRRPGQEQADVGHVRGPDRGHRRGPVEGGGHVVHRGAGPHQREGRGVPVHPGGLVLRGVQPPEVGERIRQKHHDGHAAERGGAVDGRGDPEVQGAGQGRERVAGPWRVL
mmetsp:Transcript_65444/g.108880  ORF Transcript_65444/g.108880 Transcript_65444/m.108880 type:complete len:261 (+) Transcript_65444:506-1288(+)